MPAPTAAEGDSCRAVGACVRAGGEQPRSPHRALVGGVHGRILGAMESPAKLLKLRHAAQHPGVGRDPQSVGPSTPQLSFPRRHKEGLRPRQAGGRTCSAQVRACPSALAGRWTVTAA